MTRVCKGLRALSHTPRRAVVTVGVFDGVHIAHQQLLRATCSLAKRLDGTSMAITFDPDPQRVLDPSHAPLPLMPLDARIAMLHELGIEQVWVIPFTTRFARMSAQQFVQRVLIDRLKAAAVVIGEGFLFGRNRAGDIKVLAAMGSACGMRIVQVQHLSRGGLPVSSSRIRALIARGCLAQARSLLGRPPALYGVVVRGAGRGARLGIPTANIRLIPQVLPPQGVYAVRVHENHAHRTWRGATPRPAGVADSDRRAAARALGAPAGRGVMNLGVRPTFGVGPLICEVHLLRFSGTLLGRSVSVSLLARLRDERCFPSWRALTAQVRRDILRARRLFSRLSA